MVVAVFGVVVVVLVVAAGGVVAGVVGLAGFVLSRRRSSRGSRSCCRWSCVVRSLFVVRGALSDDGPPPIPETTTLRHRH